MKRKYVIAAGIIAILILFVIYKNLFVHTKVNVIKLIKGDLITLVYATGSVTADTMATLRNESGGIVKMINTLEGSRVKKGQLLLTTDQEDKKLNLRQAQSDLERAKIELANETINFEREKKLKASNTITQNDFNNAKKDYDLAVLKVEQQNIIVDKANEDLSKTETYAPFNGVIVSSDVNLGDNLAPNSICFQIVSPSSILVEGDVDEQDLSKISLKQISVVAFDAFPDKNFDAYVYRIVPKINEATKTSKIYLKLINIPQNLNVGMTATINIETGKMNNVLLIPRSAILKDADGSYVYKIINGQLEKTIIKTGNNSGGNYTYLISGNIKAGDIIAASPSEEWKNGLKVNPVQ